MEIRTSIWCVSWRPSQEQINLSLTVCSHHYHISTIQQTKPVGIWTGNRTVAVHYSRADPLWQEWEVQPVLCTGVDISSECVCFCLRAAGPAAQGRPGAEAQRQRCPLSGESPGDSQWVVLASQRTFNLDLTYFVPLRAKTLFTGQTWPTMAAQTSRSLRRSSRDQTKHLKPGHNGTYPFRDAGFGVWALTAKSRKPKKLYYTGFKETVDTMELAF